jgi:hypothetical protein
MWVSGINYFEQLEASLRESPLPKYVIDAAADLREIMGKSVPKNH